MPVNDEVVFEKVPIPVGILLDDLLGTVEKHLAGQHDQSSHAGGKGGASAKPYREGLTGQVSATRPYVGLSEKAKSVASRISPLRNISDWEEVSTAGDKHINQVRESWATYTTESGERFQMQMQKITEPFGNSTYFSYEVTAYTGNGGFKVGKLLAFQMAVGTIDVNADERRKGIGTAMLELVRRESDGPIFHSDDLSEDGKAFAGTTKSLEKHLAGKHDQSTHGSGKVGVDSTNDLEKLFGDPSTQNLIREMNDKETSAGKGYGDNALKLIAEHQGFTGTPKTVETIADLKKLQEAEGGTIVYRGISNYSKEAYDSDGAEDTISLSADQAIEEFKNGEYYAGWGMFGNGTYTTTNLDSAKDYANAEERESGKMGKGKTMAMLIPSSALMPTPTQVQDAMKFVSVNNPSPAYKTQKNDLGRLLAAKGFQAYDSGYVQGDKSGNIVVLDRSMLTVADEVVK